jgi:hypothetical protein
MKQELKNLKKRLRQRLPKTVDIDSTLLYYLIVEFDLDDTNVQFLDDHFIQVLRDQGCLTRNKDGKLIISLEDDVVEQRYQEYRDIFKGVSPGSMGTISTVKNKLRRLLNEEDIQFDDILRAAEHWVVQKGSPFAGHADNFLYLKKKDGEISRVKQMLEFLKEKDSRESWVTDII